MFSYVFNNSGFLTGHLRHVNGKLLDRPLPPAADLETIEVFRALAEANRALAELKGRAGVIPNQGMLIDTLVLQEAKANSVLTGRANQ